MGFAGMRAIELVVSPQLCAVPVDAEFNNYNVHFPYMRRLQHPKR